MKALFYTSLILFVVGLLFFFLLYYFVMKWPLEQDVNAPLNRAQVAAQADSMLGWLEKVDSGMKKRGMTSGYATILKRTEDYNYEEIYRTLQNLKKRLEVTVQMDRATPEYQIAMDDHRGNCIELDLRIREYTWKHYRCWMTLIEILFIIPVIVVGVIWIIRAD